MRTVLDQCHPDGGGNEIPIPPSEMRVLVGPTEAAAFDNPGGGFVFPYLEPSVYESVFDFGCGCGRVARQLMLQREEPRRYLGIDLHAGMIRWCQENLTPRGPQFEFLHHDVYDASFNPGAKNQGWASFPCKDNEFSLVNAISVFTHLTEEQVQPYLREARRIVTGEGVVHASFLLLDKRAFPFMQSHANALYVSWRHPSAAVIFDREWLVETARSAGLTVVAVHPPPIRGYQWVLEMRRTQRGLEEAVFPPDSAPLGEVSIPPMPDDADRIGL